MKSRSREYEGGNNLFKSGIYMADAVSGLNSRSEVNYHQQTNY